MGTIASVLQWTCTNCNLINPTECLKCLKCGNVRQILEGKAASCTDNSKRGAEGLLATRTQRQPCDDDEHGNVGNGDATSGRRIPSADDDDDGTDQQRFAGSSALNNNEEDDDDDDKKATSSAINHHDGRNLIAAGVRASTIGESVAALRTAQPQNKTQPGYVEISSNG